MLTQTRYLELLRGTRAIAAEAGALILDIYQGRYNVEQKPDQTLVTEADYAADALICERLRALVPGWPVISEEGEIADYDQRRQWQRYWLVDPLDGTKQFVERTDEFTVNIALIEYHRPVLGVVLAPVTGDCYFAALECGAFKHTQGQVVERISTREWDGGSIVIAGSRGRYGARFQEFIAQFPGHQMKCLGSSLKSCLIAEGAADVYLRMGPTSEWDTAAAQCILEEAGGALTDTELRPLRYNTKDELLNPHFLAVGDQAHDWARYIPRP